MTLTKYDAYETDIMSARLSSLGLVICCIHVPVNPLPSITMLNFFFLFCSCHQMFPRRRHIADQVHLNDSWGRQWCELIRGRIYRALAGRPSTGPTEAALLNPAEHYLEWSSSRWLCGLLNGRKGKRFGLREDCRKTHWNGPGCGGFGFCLPTKEHNHFRGYHSKEIY